MDIHQAKLHIKNIMLELAFTHFHGNIGTMPMSCSFCGCGFEYFFHFKLYYCVIMHVKWLVKCGNHKPLYKLYSHCCLLCFCPCLFSIVLYVTTGWLHLKCKKLQNITLSEFQSITQHSPAILWTVLNLQLNWKCSTVVVLLVSVK